ncbi:hypothetical protein EV368DRAFT_88722 [Lentinula lateritia]|nr:hypothetical protein EV368DRAFT_88722 [Lentinula lateritia]
MTLNNAPPQSSSAIVDKETKSRHQKSSAIVLLEIGAPNIWKQSEYFTTMAQFMLKDLILSHLRSASQPTSTAALQFLQAMLLQHPHLCTDKLLIVVADPLATAFPHPILIASRSGKDENDDEEETFIYPAQYDISTHEREMDLHLALVSRVDPSHNSDPFSTGYDNYLRDAVFYVQDQPAYQLDDIDRVDTEARQKAKHFLCIKSSYFAASPTLLSCFATPNCYAHHTELPCRAADTNFPL